MDVIIGAEISVKLLPSVEYMVFPLRFTKSLPVGEIAKSHMFPPNGLVQVVPPSVVFLNPVVVAAYIVLPEGSEGSASILGTEAQLKVGVNSVQEAPSSVDLSTPFPANWGEDVEPPP